MGWEASKGICPGGGDSRQLVDSDTHGHLLTLKLMVCQFFLHPPGPLLLQWSSAFFTTGELGCEIVDEKYSFLRLLPAV